MTVKQLLVLYATIFMFLIAAVVVTLAGFSLVQASRRVYRRAVADEMHRIATRGSIADIRADAQKSTRSGDIQLAIVTATVSGLEVTLAGARDAADHPSTSSAIISERLEVIGGETYLVG